MSRPDLPLGVAPGGGPERDAGLRKCRVDGDETRQPRVRLCCARKFYRGMGRGCKFEGRKPRNSPSTRSPTERAASVSHLLGPHDHPILV